MFQEINLFRTKSRSMRVFVYLKEVVIKHQQYSNMT